MRGSASFQDRFGLVALGAALLSLFLSPFPAAGEPSTAPPSFYGFQGESGRLGDADFHTGWVEPTAEQEAVVADLGATVRWSAFGTPRVLVRHGGYLATGLEGDAVTAAREWVRANRVLFRLSREQVDSLEVLRDSPLYDSPDLVRVYRRGLEARNPDVAHVVLFRQRFGDLSAAQDGLLNVGIDAHGRIAWVSATTTGDDQLNTTQPRIDAPAALRLAAQAVGRDVFADGLRSTGQENGWETFAVDGVDDVQRARLVAMPTPSDGVRLAWETLLLDGTPANAQPTGFTQFVDAVDGDVLFRSNVMQHFARPGVLAQSDGEQDQSFPFPPQWLMFPANPQLVDAKRPGEEAPEGASQDTRQLWCWTPVHDEEGNALCDRVVGEDDLAGFFNGASRGPWDYDFRSESPTFTSEGNNADTAPSFFSPFTPDADKVRAHSPDRVYDYPWSNQWYERDCNPSVFSSPQRNDIDAATNNLFVGHNRMHDWGYYLGWTEINSNMQTTNFGLTGPERANDPESGQSQAGSTTGTVTPLFGRDNANQITPNDGVPGITNQYLWQPFANAIYVPCVDGAYDMAVISHEVGHAIQNRMTAGPDAQLNGHQARSMGESWSDLTTIEYLNGFGFVPTDGENPFSVGAYVTGDPQRGVRNFGMNNSPLNYSNVGYDFIGPQVHADGEIWSAANFALREALITKYDAQFPADRGRLQTRCAEGQLPADDCPGNRRWTQLVHDAFLLQPSQTSMVDSRDAMLAADMLRFDGANQDELWNVFAEHGLGTDAESPEFQNDDGETQSGVNNVRPVPGFASPAADNATVTFAPVARDGGPAPANVRVFVGEYEARSRPVAEINVNPEDDPHAEVEGRSGTGTEPQPDLDATVEFAPGTYDLFAVAPGFGGFRFTGTFQPGEQTTVELALPRNLASRYSGAEVTDGDGVNKNKLIDDTEATNWAVVTCQPDETAAGRCAPQDNEPPAEPDTVEGRQVTVDLAGEGAQLFDRVQVSAMLRPTESEDPGDDPEEEPGEEAGVGDIGAQNRFSALKAFQILACNADAGADCASDDSFEVVFTSDVDAFPGGVLRPRVNDLTLRAFEVPATEATHVRLRALTNQCTGTDMYQGSLDADPSNDTDCATESAAGLGTLLPPQGENVRAAELQVFAPGDPCANVPVASNYVDRERAREVHVRNVDCVIFNRISIGTVDAAERRYGPRQDVTRGQMASFVANTLQAAGHADALPPPGRRDRFDDIAGNVHRDNINRLARAGIVAGKGDGRFNPDETIRREDMATFMVNAAGFALGQKPTSETSYFGDVPTSNVHHDNIDAGFAAGLFTGTTPPTPGEPDSGRFRPNDSVLRDQMASFLVNLLLAVFQQSA